jgi:hypothetical protein
MAIAPIIGEDADIVYRYGVDFLVKISEPPMSLTEPKSKKVRLIKKSIKKFFKEKGRSFSFSF